MNITDVRVKKLDVESKIKAIVSITFDDVFVVHGLKVLEGEAGLFVVMPSKKSADGEYKDIAHPLNQELRDEINKKVVEAYNKL